MKVYIGKKKVELKELMETIDNLMSMGVIELHMEEDSWHFVVNTNVKFKGKIN